MDTGVARRFWPSRAIAPRTTPEAAAAIAGILHGTIEAGLERYGRAAMALTAGYETRTLLACAGHLRKRLSYFTIVDASTPWYDYRIPARLARKMALDYRHVWGRGRQGSAIRAMKNTGYLADPKEHLVAAFGLIDPQSMLGNASRCVGTSITRTKPHPTSVTRAHRSDNWLGQRLAG